MKNTTIKSLFITASLVITTSGYAAGLDDLSNANPENTEQESDEEAKTDEAEGAPAAEAEAKANRPLSDMLYLSTSYGWVSAALSEGDWNSSGMSDFTVGYKVANMGFDVFATYRYAPMALAGSANDQAYRGVIEVHNFGGLGLWKIKDGLTAVGTAELGIAVVSLDSTDGLIIEEDLEATGAVLSVGGGADWKMGEKFNAGPRLYVGAGSATVIQLSGQATFFF
jgi:hypothetical protein